MFCCFHYVCLCCVFVVVAIMFLLLFKTLSVVFLINRFLQWCGVGGCVYVLSVIVII